MRYFWGLVLMAIGGAYLSASLGYTNYDQISQLWIWWPLVLVFIGFDLLLKKYKYGWMVMIALTLLAGFIVYDISFAPNSYITPNKSYRQTREVSESKISIDKNNNVKEAEIKIKTGAVEFDINGNTEKLVEGMLKSNISEASVANDISGDRQISEISTESGMHKITRFRNLKNKLELALNKTLPIFLKINSGASTLDFDLSQYALSGLDIDAGASTIDLKIGELIQNGAKITIDSGASTIDIEVPKKIGVRIKTDAGLSSKNYSGFSTSGDYSENEAYKTATKKIDIEVKAGVSTINVKEK